MASVAAQLAAALPAYRAAIEADDAEQLRTRLNQANTGCSCLQPFEADAHRCRNRRSLVDDVQPPMHRTVPEGGDRVVRQAAGRMTPAASG